MTPTEITREVKAYPRGDAAQNLFRSVYNAALRSAFGPKEYIPPSRAAAYEQALGTVRAQHPEFIPTRIE